MLHEALVLLFRNRPPLAAEILRDVLAHPLPEFDQIQIEDSDLAQLVPTEYRADLVLLLRRDEPVLGIVVEVQLAPDPDKRFSWPLYAAALRARLRCATCVLVVTPYERVARWALEPIDTGQPGSSFTPLVVGPSAVPRITDADSAVRSPEKALLSAFAHGQEPGGLDVAIAALAGAAGLDGERAMVYFDLIHMAVGDSVRKQLEDLMEKGTYEYQSEFARRWLAEGKSLGRAEGRAEAVLTFLEARGIAVSDEVRDRILGCREIATLDRWIARAAVAASAAEVLDDD
jgi:hypothetical protein